MRNAIMCIPKAYSWPWKYTEAIPSVVEAMHMYLLCFIPLDQSGALAANNIFFTFHTVITLHF
jgi:hypothetical protein